MASKIQGQGLTVPEAAPEHSKCYNKKTLENMSLHKRKPVAFQCTLSRVCLVGSYQL